MIEIKRVLCPIDFSEFSHHALDCAVAMARWYGGSVTVLHVFANWPIVNAIPSLGPTAVEPLSLRPEDRIALERELAEAVGAHAGDVDVTVVLREALDIHREILAQAESLHADLLVMGSHGRSGFDRLMLGSMTEKVLRKATCPVMVVPRRVGDARARHVHFQQILCPVDFSDCSLDAVAYALSLAQEADAHLTLLNVIELPPELLEAPTAAGFGIDAIQANVESERLSRLQGLVPDAVRPFCTVETAVHEGRASREILRQAAERKSDLIVMGVRGRGAIDLMVFGSTTRAVSQDATCPVLTIRRK
jgi:nucleotide-binding universal stress UspA family protein